jgi:hypothetical protein
MKTTSCLGLLFSVSLLGLVSCVCGCASERSSAPPADGPSPKLASDDDARAAGRKWAAAFWAKDTQAMWTAMDAPMRDSFGDKAGLDAFREQAGTLLGEERELLREDVEAKGGGVVVYHRVARFAKTRQPFLLMVGMVKGKIGGFAVQAADALPAPAETTKLGYVTASPLRLPFDGAWTVAWGGRTLADNQHVVMRDQRFAYDFVVENGGTTHRGDGSRNDDYFCYGRPILAPAAGRIASVVDGVPENRPGEMDARHPAGNYVIIDHGHDEYSLLAHLVPNSLSVKAGDTIVAGQPVGRCGNSGHSSEPHLHYHLQNGPRFGDADGLPAQFRDYRANGSAVGRGEPLRGQTIQASSPQRT